MENLERNNALGRAAYMRGRDDARAGFERFPRSQHPEQYWDYNAGWYDWHKLQAFPAMAEALRAFVRQRDYFAANGRWDQSTFRPDSDQCFDDWAADISSQLLARINGESGQ